MNILISGGTGLIGSAFSHWVHQHISNEQNRSVNITWLTRDIEQPHPDFITMLNYEQLKTTNETFDIILNLAGAGIADKRWSDERRELLIESRIKPTQAIIDYISKTDSKPKLMLSGSAIGWYGNQGDKPLDENSNYENHSDEDFAHQICELWEAKAKEALKFKVPVVILRTGIVIHPDGGMLAKLLPSFKMGMGGQLGNGKQIMSWISLNDWVRAAWHIIQHHLDFEDDNNTVNTADEDDDKNCQSNSVSATVYNLTAPEPVSNAKFTKIVGNWLHRPTFVTLPEGLLKLMFGDMATLLIDGQKVLPKQLLESGFEFNHVALRQALSEQKGITNLS